MVLDGVLGRAGWFDVCSEPSLPRLGRGKNRPGGGNGSRSPPDIRFACKSYSYRGLLSRSSQSQIPRRSFTRSSALLLHTVRPIHHSETFHLTLSLQASLHFCSECNNLLYIERSNNVEPWSTRAAPVQTSTRPSTAVWSIGNDLLNVTKFSQIVRVLLGISAREQAGVTTDLAQDPTLVRRS